MRILSTMQIQEKLSTNSPLDELLEGGIDKRTITQIYGPPGVGKTNVALNIAVNVAKGGKKVIYIDTEGGISVDRIKQISGDDFDDVAKNIVVFEPTSFKEQEEDLDLITGGKTNWVWVLVKIGNGPARWVLRKKEDV